MKIGEVLPKKYSYVKVWENEMALIDLLTGKTITEKSIAQFSTKRVVLADFNAAQELLMSMLDKLYGKKILHLPRVMAIQQLDIPNGGLTSIEFRALKDCCFFSGAMRALVILPGVHHSNREILNMLKDRRNF